MGGACGTYGGEETCIQGFGGRNLRERDHLEDPGVDGRIITLVEPKDSLPCLKYLANGTYPKPHPDTL
jgi:hypothetical protein